MTRLEFLRMKKEKLLTQRNMCYGGGRLWHCATSVEDCPFGCVGTVTKDARNHVSLGLLPPLNINSLSVIPDGKSIFLE